MIRIRTLECLSLFESSLAVLATTAVANDDAQPAKQDEGGAGAYELLPAGTRSPHHIAENVREQVNRFRLWSANIGTMAKQRVSLDYRLRQAPDIAELILQMLEVVAIRLKHLEPDSAAGGTYEQTDLATKQDEALHALAQDITTLQRLSCMIRTSGGIGLLSGAGSYVLEDEDAMHETPVSGLDRDRLLRTQRWLAVLTPTETEPEPPMPREKNETFSVDFEGFVQKVLQHRYPNTDAKILEHLALFIKTRRQRLAYVRSHQRKPQHQDYAYHRYRPTNVRPTSSTFSEPSSEISDQITGSLVDRDPTVSVCSSTLASAIDPEIYSRIRGQAPSSAATSAITPLSLANPDIPPAPFIPDNVQEHKCPYCQWTLAAKHFRRRELWRRHVEEDLEPYLCLDQACLDTQTTFGKMSEWVAHTHEMHSRTWFCPFQSPQTQSSKNSGKLNDCSSTFSNSVGLEEHLTTSHTTLSVSKVRTIADMSFRRDEYTIFHSCLFCGWQPPEGQLDRSSTPGGVEAVQNHIANHLLSLATIALPGRDDLTCMDEGDTEGDSVLAVDSLPDDLTYMDEEDAEDASVLAVGSYQVEPGESDSSSEGHIRREHRDYKVALICPLEVEQVAVLEMLDEHHPPLPQPENDHNAYNLGSIYGHNVVIAGLPTSGNCSAATIVAQMRNTYPRLRFGLLVGIGGGVPTHTDAGPIRLGHIVVSQSVGQHSGAVQYDHGQAKVNKFVRTGFLAPPPMVLLNAVRKLQVSRGRASVDPLTSHLERIDTTERRLRNFRRPRADQDQLYEPGYTHLDKEKSCKKCGCDASKRVERDVDDSDSDSVNDEDNDWLVVHRGTIASGELVIRNGLQRDVLARDHKILCFEMEAAGALNDFPCLVVRGISDYSDSHKNDKWHGYAAAVAAAYARELFQHMPVEEVKQCRIAATDVERLLQNTRESADYILESRIIEWLSPSDASVNLVNASKLRYSDTGRWFLESDRYKWLQSTPGASLWLRGIPGCGKTVLSSTIIKDLQLNNRTTGTAIVYFFFSFSDESKQKLDHMLRSLIFQLVTWNQGTKVHLLKMFVSSGHGRKPPQTMQLIEVFNQIVNELQDVIIVLDALDESKDRHDLLQWITSTSNLTCRFILTSRSDRSIEQPFASRLSRNSTITLESNLVGDDIEAYVHYRLDVEEHLSHWRPMHEEIASILVHKAAGMFRWVHCQLQELSKCLDNSAVLRTLHTPSNDLNEIYDRILQSIPRRLVPNAIKLLQLLTFAKRPLQLEEVIDAMATEPDMELPFEARNRISPPEDIVKHCSSLIRITTADSNDSKDELRDHIGQLRLERGFTPVDRRETTIQFAHFSVREYLLLDRKENPYYRCFGKTVANGAITRIFLAYLWTAAEAQKTPEDSSEYPMIKLATQYWMDHATTAGEEEEATFAWTRKIFTNSNFLQYWARLRSGGESFHANSALYYASHFALHRSVSYLLSMGADPNAEGGRCGNPLQAATMSGDAQTVETLLDYGAKPKAIGGWYGSALHAAAWHGHIGILQLLLEYGADVGALKWQGGSAASALQVAAYQGHTEIVETLLMHGAEVNACNVQISAGIEEFNRVTRCYTALEAASLNNRVEVVRILLNNNAEINARGPCSGARGADKDSSGGGYIYGTPLQAASMMGHLNITRILVESGADVNVSGGRWGYALHAALSNAHTEVSRFLIESGADIQAEGGVHRTTLYAAVDNGDLAMVQLLMKNGLDANNSENDGRTPLICACEAGRAQIVELLLDNGADVNAQGGYHGTALCAASYKGFTEIVQMLLANGSAINVQAGKYNNNALQSCCRYDSFHPINREVVQLLLDNGADVNAQEGEYGTALYAASLMDDVEVVHMLLKAGAIVNVDGKYENCALCAAADGGGLEVGRILLKHDSLPGSSKVHEMPLVSHDHKELADLIGDDKATIEADYDPHLKRRALDPSIYSHAEKRLKHEDVASELTGSTRKRNSKQELGNNDNLAWLHGQTTMEDVLSVVAQARAKAIPAESRYSKISGKLNEISSRTIYYGGVLDALEQHHPKHVSLAWGATKFVLMGIIEHGELLHKFAQAFVEIGDALYLATCSALIYGTIDLEATISQLYLEIMRFLSKAVEWYTRNPIRRMLSAIANPWELEYKDCLERIRSHVTKVNNHAVRASWAELRVVHDDLSTRGTKLNNVEVVVSSLQTRFDEMLKLLQHQLQVNLNHRDISITLRNDMNEVAPEIRDLQVRTILKDLRPDLDPDHNLLQMQLVLEQNSNLRDFLQNGDHLRRCIERWFKEPASSLLIAKVAIRYKIMAKTMLVDLIRALQSSIWPTFFVLPKATLRSPTDHSTLLATWIRAMIHQLVKRNPDCLSRSPEKLQTVQYYTDHSPAEWMHLLGQLLASLPGSCLVLDTIDLYERYHDEPDTFQGLIDLLKGLIETVRTAQGHTKVFVLYYGSNLHTDSSQESQPQELTCSLQYRPVPPKLRARQAHKTTAQQIRLQRVTKGTS